MLILGIETSCDETAAAVVRDGRERLSDVVSSQVEIHREWGGVVPELASRSHVQRVLPVVDQALAEAGVELSDIDLFAVTSGPGLIGALLVGVQAAKALAWAAGKPVVGVNHLEGHLWAIRLAERFPEPPFLGLVVSGGHTSLYAVEGEGELRLLGQTLDDAAGEAFDKVAKLLGLPYPGGVVIDRLAAAGDPGAIDFPRGLARKPTLDFSFSGLKTAVLYHVKKYGIPEGRALSDLCASVQEAIADVLSAKAVRAAREYGLDRLVLAGGVAANSRLRALVQERGEAEGIEVFLPPKSLCTDNGAMIAVAGYLRHLRGLEPMGFSINADPAWRP
jgi:N6-L-threonylcarbamoyladenine synthase